MNELIVSPPSENAAFEAAGGPAAMVSPVAGPRLSTLAKDLAAASPPERTAILAAFWSKVLAQGTPLIEGPAPGHPGHSLVTFLRRSDGDERALLSTTCDWFAGVDGELQRLPGTDVQYLSWVVPDDLRTCYGFVLSGPDSEPDPDDHASRDPLSRHTQISDWGTDPEADSVLVMPAAAALPTLPSAESWQPPAEHVFTSTVLGNSRAIWVSIPPGEAADLPVLIVFDGVARHSAARLVRSLSDAGRIPPTAVVLVSPVTDNGRARHDELPCNDDFAAMIATELLPWIRENYPVTSDPSRVVATGYSFGGLAALWLGLRHPEAVGVAIAQSTSCWYHPRVWERRRHGPPPAPAPMLSPGASTPTIIEAFRTHRPVPLRIWHNVGRFEESPNNESTLGMVMGNRWLHDVLTTKGYDTHFHEFSGGHDDAWWRGLLADGLVWALGADQPVAGQGSAR